MHHFKVFEPHPREITTEENSLLSDINTAKMVIPAKPFIIKEI